MAKGAKHPQSLRRRGEAEGVPDAAERVVGVHKQNRVPGKRPLEGLEGVLLAVEELNEGVGHGAVEGKAELLSGQNVAGPGAAADERCPGREEAGLGPLRAAAAEVDHRPAPGGAAEQARLGGHRRLVADRRDQVGLQELRLHDGGPDLENRFVRKEWGSLGQGPEIAAEPEITEIVEESWRNVAEDVQSPQPVQDGFRKVHVQHLVQRLFQTGGDQKAPLRRQPAGKEFESGPLLGEPRLEVGGQHGQFVKVGVDAQGFLGGKQGP